LPTVPTVDSEIFVGREDDGTGERFGHANEASIGQAHCEVRILLGRVERVNARRGGLTCYQSVPFTRAVFSKSASLLEPASVRPDFISISPMAKRE
jgi:hypothetical protein